MSLQISRERKESLKILVVDDISSMRRVVAAFLFELGFRCITQADSGPHALAALRQERFDFVLTDWSMPGMTGLELLQAIRKDESLKHLPVLLITAEARKENIIAAGESGASGYVVKPFSIVVLGEKMDQILRRTAAAASAATGTS